MQGKRTLTHRTDLSGPTSPFRMHSALTPLYLRGKWSLLEEPAGKTRYIVVVRQTCMLCFISQQNITRRADAFHFLRAIRHKTAVAGAGTTLDTRSTLFTTKGHFSWMGFKLLHAMVCPWTASLQRRHDEARSRCMSCNQPRQACHPCC